MVGAGGAAGSGGARPSQLGGRGRLPPASSVRPSPTGGKRQMVGGEAAVGSNRPSPAGRSEGGGKRRTVRGGFAIRGNLQSPTGRGGKRTLMAAAGDGVSTRPPSVGGAGGARPMLAGGGREGAGGGDSGGGEKRQLVVVGGGSAGASASSSGGAPPPVGTGGPAGSSSRDAPSSGSSLGGPSTPSAGSRFFFPRRRGAGIGRVPFSARAALSPGFSSGCPPVPCAVEEDVPAATRERLMSSWARRRVAGARQGDSLESDSEFSVVDEDSSSS